MRTLALFLAGLAIMPLAAAANAAVIGHMNPAPALSEARIAQLPKAEQGAWLAYLARSRVLMAADKAALAAERRGIETPPPAQSGPSGGGGMRLDRPAEWLAGAEARQIADNIVSFQTPAGGWGKNQNRSAPTRLHGQAYVALDHAPAAARAELAAEGEDWSYVGTIDNNATTSELRFLARVQAAHPGPDGNAYRAAFLKGISYLLAAQYPNGGWPQVYPLQGGYHDAVTFNDDAIALVVSLLSDVGNRGGDFAFVPADLAAAAGLAGQRALAMILKSQVIVGGKRTIWGQQHDALSLAPAGARNFEPASLSAGESAGLLVLLMRQPNPTPAMAAAIRDGVEWLRAHALHDVEWIRAGPDGRRLAAKPGAEPIWSRFYDIATGRPIFGDRDKTIHDDVNELSAERRNGYSWFNTGPAKALKAYEKWSAKRPAAPR
jgi:PelA/Pel-15E family pectate lyase